MMPATFYAVLCMVTIFITNKNALEYYIFLMIRITKMSSHHLHMLSLPSYVWKEVWPDN
jgi:hypothetical protein